MTATTTAADNDMKKGGRNHDVYKQKDNNNNNSKQQQQQRSLVYGLEPHCSQYLIYYLADGKQHSWVGQENFCFTVLSHFAFLDMLLNTCEKIIFVVKDRENYITNKSFGCLKTRGRE